MRTSIYTIVISIAIVISMISCAQNSDQFDISGITAAEMLGNPHYRAISYGGYRESSRDIQPTIGQLKEDMLLLSAMGIKVLRTYNVHFDEAENVLKAIEELMNENPDFEMYVMLGAWIDAKNAWSDLPDRIRNEDSPRNAIEIDKAVRLAQQYPQIVKILAVGNEAMVHWATEYFVEPSIILNWVNHLQELKKDGKLPSTLWITSSDNFASWGGGGAEYHNDDLNELIRTVDYISMHTYPMHDTHYNPQFWGFGDDEMANSDLEKIHAAMLRARDYAIHQYESVVSYMKKLDVEKPVHIGETGWATISNEYYGPTGAKSIDEYKAGLYYQLMREWTDNRGISMFYFEAFDEQWKDAANPLGSENHFGLITLQSQAKYAIWNLVDAGVFDGLTRDGKSITKTYGGDLDSLMQDVLAPPSQTEIDLRLGIVQNQN
jgi:exo-beta-1,3-glucanase (GH17 family)